MIFSRDTGSPSLCELLFHINYCTCIFNHLLLTYTGHYTNFGVVAVANRYNKNHQHEHHRCAEQNVAQMGEKINLGPSVLQCQTDNIHLHYWRADTWKICFHTGPQAGHPHLKPELQQVSAQQPPGWFLLSNMRLLSFFSPFFQSEGIITPFSLESYFPPFHKSLKGFSPFFLTTGGDWGSGRWSWTLFSQW